MINFIILYGNNTSIKTIPNSLSITVYNIGKGLDLVNTVEHSKTSRFVANLEVGQQYILLPVATWLAQKGNIGTTNAFVSYSYRINLIS